MGEARASRSQSLGRGQGRGQGKCLSFESLTQATLHFPAPEGRRAEGGICVYFVSTCPPERPAYFLSREDLPGPDPWGEQQNQMSTEASTEVHLGDAQNPTDP